MNPYNIKVGMTLYCKNGETVIVTAIGSNEMQLNYKGRTAYRKFSCINQTLFLENPCKKNEQITPRSKTTPKPAPRTTPTYTPTPAPNLPFTPHPTIDFSAQDKIELERCCRNCKFQHSGECSSWDVCDDFQPVYRIPKQETDLWPEYGDATLFKRKSRKK